MHRAPARHFPVSQPLTQLPAKPQLVLIHGGKLEDDPLVVMVMALFLLELRRLVEKNRLRRLHASAMATSPIMPASSPEPEPEEVTGVHPILDDAAFDRILNEVPLPAPVRKKVPRQNRPRPLEVTPEVAGQFVRLFLRATDGIDHYLDKQSEKVMNARLHTRQKFKPFKDVRALEWSALQEHVRTVVMAMLPTNRHTQEGHTIRWQPPTRDDAGFEAVVDMKERRILRIYVTQRPRNKPPKMARPRPYGRRLPRS